MSIGPSADPQTVLAFDFGLRRIGVAVGNTLLGTANPLTTIINSSDQLNWGQVLDVIGEWQPDALIVGLPLHIDDNPSKNADLAREFALMLESKTNKTVILVDEKLSSQEAKGTLRAARESGLRKRSRKGDVDKFAAQVILRSWLNHCKSHSTITHDK